MKRKEVEYCVEGYHSFKSVEHSAFVGLLQTCVNFGAKYGKFEIGKALYMRKTVSRETGAVAANVKVRLSERLKDAIDDGAVSLSIDISQTIIGSSHTLIFMPRGWTEISVVIMRFWQ